MSRNVTSGENAILNYTITFNILENKNGISHCANAGRSGRTREHDDIKAYVFNLYLRNVTSIGNTATILKTVSADQTMKTGISRSVTK